MQRLAHLAARALRRGARTLEEFGATQQFVVKRAMAGYDMMSHPDEEYYQQQYWHWLQPVIERCFPARQAHALDLGCGQGRLTLPLAAWLIRGKVVGVDLAGTAIKQARDYASEQKLTNIEFHEGDAFAFVRALPDASVDLALMTEVAYFMPTYRELIADLARVLKPAGVFFCSFRSQYFDLLYSVRKRDWPSAFLVRDAREGHWGGSSTWFSWHTSADVRELLSEAGLTVTQLRGIGIASGIEGDALSCIARPSNLTPADLAQLLELETSLSEPYADCGRYILAVASKSA